MQWLGPQADQNVAKAPQLYDPRNRHCDHTLVSLCDAFLISRNFAALGEHESARKALALGFVGLLPLAFFLVLVPASPRYDGVTRPAFQLRQVAIVHLSAVRVQGNAIAKHRVSGGLFYSRWRAAGISLLLILIIVPILFGMYLFASKLMRAPG
jgi:hypothetical protein